MPENLEGQDEDDVPLADPFLQLARRRGQNMCAMVKTLYTKSSTVEAKKLEYDCPPTPKPRAEGKPA